MRPVVRPFRLPLLLTCAVLLWGCRASPTALPVPMLAIVTESLPPAVRGAAYGEAIHAAGGDGAYHWDIVAGALPEGLALLVDDLDTDHAMVTGTADDVETATFTVRLRSGDGQSVTRQFTIPVLPEPDPLALHHRRLPPALVGAPYRVKLRANGGDGEQYDWAIVAGRLPAGLTLTDAGRFEGTPSVVETTSFAVEVRSGGLASRQDYDLAVIPHDTTAFRITLFEATDVPAGVRPHLDAALARLEAAITGNLPPVAIPDGFFSPGHCAGFGSQINGASANDLLIILSIVPIDGPGRVLGQAGPCAVRQGSSLPFAGVVVLDQDDVVPLLGTETLTDIIVHEIAHVLGFGTLWEMHGLIQGAGTPDPRFTGPRAMAEYQNSGGAGTIELENQGGAGTAEGHWRKTVFHIEIMTGFAEPVGVAQPLSRVTIASWADLGYTVNPAAADAFSLSRGAGVAPRRTAAETWRDLLGHDHVYHGPILVLHDDGGVTMMEKRR
jgi:hypothetical protein